MTKSLQRHPDHDLDRDLDRHRDRRRSQALRGALVALLLGGAAAAHAAGKIELTNTVEKVVTTTAADGTATTELQPAEKVVPGETLRYTITFANVGDQPVDAGSIVVTNPMPPSTEYIADSAVGAGTVITYSVDGGNSFGTPAELKIITPEGERAATAADYTTIRWRFEPELAAGEKSHVAFQVRLR